MQPSDLKHQLNSTEKPNIVMSHGKGSWLWDEEGRRYLDYVQGWAVNCLGHAPDAIRDALAKQADHSAVPWVTERRSVA